MYWYLRNHYSFADNKPILWQSNRQWTSQSQKRVRRPVLVPRDVNSGGSERRKERQRPGRAQKTNPKTTCLQKKELADIGERFEFLFHEYICMFVEMEVWVLVRGEKLTVLFSSYVHYNPHLFIWAIRNAKTHTSFLLSTRYSFRFSGGFYIL